jgi:hypothetical protein
MVGALADERDPIRTRTGEGRARAVARGVRMGRPPKLTPHQQREAIDAILPEWGCYYVSNWKEAAAKRGRQAIVHRRAVRTPCMPLEGLCDTYVASAWASICLRRVSTQRALLVLEKAAYLYQPA